MKYGFFVVGFALLFIGGIFWLAFSDGSSGEPAPNVQNVTTKAGKQIVEIRAKGGYQPRVSIAKAGVPTIVRLTTSSTFDCSSAVRIPSLGFNKNLPASGSTDIEIKNPQVGTLKGSCGMGMYYFDIQFQS